MAELKNKVGKFGSLDEYTFKILELETENNKIREQF